MELLIIAFVVGFIINTVKKASQEQSNQQGKQAQGQFNQQQRPNVQKKQRQYTLREMFGEAFDQSPRAGRDSGQGTSNIDQQPKDEVLEDRVLSVDYDLDRTQDLLEVEEEQEESLSIDLTEDTILQGIIFSEILGSPKSREG
ncbi:MAG TPA: hypothetical protein VFD33_06160 [Bacillota bacterium]|nr:hypothetical protein [Bacillota bacterium]